MKDTQPLRGNVFVAVGENGLRAFSSDGKTWTHMQTDREGVLLHYACFFKGRCFAGGRFGGELVAYHTKDGVAWQSGKLDSKPYAERLELLFATDREVCGIISSDGAPPQAIRTQDGKTWTARKALVDDWRVMVRDAHLRRVARGNGRIVFTGDYGARLSGKTLDEKFQAVPKASAKDTLIDITFGNGVFVGSGLHALRMRSKDGLDWTDRTVGEEGEHINSMIFDGKQFVGIGQGATYTSPDGAEWKRTPNKNAPTVAAFGQGVYVGAVWPGKLLRSSDGIDWAEVHLFPHNVLTLAYGQIGLA
jgi:hypothetical protein